MKTCLPLALLLSTHIAAADEPLVLDRVCAEIDGVSDEATRQTLVRVLEHEDLFVVETNCTRTVHVAAGSYDQMRLAFKTAQVQPATDAEPPPAAKLPVAEPAIEQDAQAPVDTPTVTDDRMLYARVGVRPLGGSGAAIGYRRGFGTLAIDVALQGFAAGTDPDPDASSGTSLGVALLGMLRPTRTHTPYIGGGLALSSMTVAGNGMEARGGGLAASLTAGVEIHRDAAWRFFAQADALLPLYRLDTAYTPACVLSIGVGR